MVCLLEEAKVGKGRYQSSLGRNKHGKMEGQGDKKRAGGMQIGCWSVGLSGHALCWISIGCPVFLLNSISRYFHE